MKDLFDNTYFTFDINELQCGDFSFFKKGSLLNSDNFETIDMFYSKIYNSWDKIPFYHCVPGINSITGDNKYRFMIIKINDDEVFFAYKVIQILTTKQIRVFDKVVSKTDNLENEIAVTNILYEKSFVKFAFSIIPNLPFNILGNARPLLEYNNYYYQRKEFFDTKTNKEIKRLWSKFIAKHDGFSCLTKLKEKGDAIDIRNDFNKYLVDNGHKTNVNDKKEYMSFVSQRNPHVRFLAIYKNDEIISLTVLYVIEKLRLAYSIYDMHKRIDDTTEKDVRELVSHRMTERIKYLLFTTYQDIDTVFILGCRPTEHRLINHKEMVSDGKIEYFLL